MMPSPVWSHVPSSTRRSLPVWSHAPSRGRGFLLGVFSQGVFFCYWPSGINGLLLIMTEGQYQMPSPVVTSSGSHCSSLKAFLFVHVAMIMFTKHDSIVN